MKKLLLAIVVAYVVLMGTNYLVHGIWLAPDYAATENAHRTFDEIQRRMWIMAIGQFFFAAVFAYVYTRGAENKPWMAQGIRYGIVMSFLTVIPGSLSQYVTYFLPHVLAVKWMIAGTIQLVILGLIVAGICKNQSTG